MLRRSLLFALLSLLLFPISAMAWKDPVHGFSINIPAGWRSQVQEEQGMRNVILLNQDDSIAVGITSIDAGKSFSAEQLVQAFEPTFVTKILAGGRRTAIEGRNQNGLPGLYGHYQGPYNGDAGVVQADARMFYTVRGTVGHVVWCIVPSNQAAMLMPQAEQTMASFSFDQDVAQPPQGGGLGGLLNSPGAPLTQPTGGADGK